jgi:hypothetical protein
MSFQQTVTTPLALCLSLRVHFNFMHPRPLLVAAPAPVRESCARVFRGECARVRASLRASWGYDSHKRSDMNGIEVEM